MTVPQIGGHGRAALYLRVSTARQAEHDEALLLKSLARPEYLIENIAEPCLK